MRSCMHFWCRKEELPWTRTAVGLLTPGRAVTNLRPISIRDAVRRLAAKAMLLQLGSRVEAILRETNQYAAGAKNGADLVYHKLNESLDSYVAAAVASGITTGDAKNVSCKGHCHAGEKTNCGPSRSWIRGEACLLSPFKITMFYHLGETFS